MNIAYGSDFHFEFYLDIEVSNIICKWSFDPSTDFIVIAGDLHVGSKKVIKTLSYIYDCHNIPILYVPGNHEYYGSSFKKEDDEFYLYGLSGERFDIFLYHNKIIDNINFIGCVGNIDGSYEKIEKWKHGALNDFHRIEDFEDHEERGKREHEMMKHYLIDSSYVNSKSVCITHSMPSPRCINKKYENSYLNPCFANDWEDLIIEYKPQLWICGHTHDEFDIIIDETRVVCNPCGYPHENKKWEWKYVSI